MSLLICYTTQCQLCTLITTRACACNTQLSTIFPTRICAYTVTLMHMYASQVLVQVLSLAFLVVVGSVGLMIPIMLYVFNLRASGWTWQYVGLFVSMLASTDAVAIISTMKQSAPLAVIKCDRV